MRAAFALIAQTETQEVSVRGQIDSVEAVMRELPQVEIPVTHYFANGTYGREITIPAGTFLTGKVHRFNDLNIVLSGKCDVLTESGWKYCEGGSIFTGKAGTKQIGYAHTDCRWITIHATTNTNLDTLEDELLFPCEWSPHDFATGQLKANIDYKKVLEELGMTEEQVQIQVQNEEDRIDIELEGLELKESPIHGLGIFSLTSRKSDEVLGQARIAGNRTQLGRYVNHSNDPNALMVESETGIDLVSVRPIPSGSEVTVDYRKSVELARGLK